MPTKVFTAILILTSTLLLSACAREPLWTAPDGSYVPRNAKLSMPPAGMPLPLPNSASVNTRVNVEAVSAHVPETSTPSMPRFFYNQPH